MRRLLRRTKGQGARHGLARAPDRQGHARLQGETAEYFESKRGVWDHARWVLAAICLVLGTAFLVASASPVVQARVYSVTDDGVAGTNSVVLIAPDGATSTVTVPYADTPAVDSRKPAMELPGGRLVLGDHTAQGRAAAIVFLGLGVGIVLRALWRIRYPRPLMTTVLVPDETYALPPHST